MSITWRCLYKLVHLGLVRSDRRGKVVLFSTTPEGQACNRCYREVREACLAAAIAQEGTGNAKLAELAAFLRFLSGRYDQAARASTSL